MITFFLVFVDESKETNLQKKCTFTPIIVCTMKPYLVSLIKLWIYWMLLFVFFRSLFLAFYIPALNEQGLAFFSVLPVYYHALRVDMATACFLLIPSLFLLAIAYSIPNKWGHRIHFWTVWLLSLFCVLVYEGEIGLYQEWKTKLNYKAVSALATPGDVLVSVSLADTVLFFTLLAALAYVLMRVLKKWVLPMSGGKDLAGWRQWLLFPVMSALCFVGIRGLDRFPLAVSQASFSNVQFLNDVATNSVYFLAYNTSKSTARKSEKRYSTLPEEQALELVREMHESQGVQTDQLLDLERVPQPNLVFLIVESWQYDIANPNSQYMPFFSDLCSRGLFFSEFYANGSHSDQGIASIFSGFPSLSSVSLPRSQDKYALAPSLLKPYRDQGYASLFQYGGQLYFGGIQAYVYHLGFEKVFDVKDFDKSIPQGSVGVHDEDNLRVFGERINQLQTPFFAACYTISTHAPYDSPAAKKYQNMAESDYVNAMHYADQAVKKFFDQAQKQPWFRNTLFVFVPDHGHPTHMHSTYRSFGICRLPMLWVGEALKSRYAGKTIDRLCSQVDIAKTLLHQTGKNAEAFAWSKDIFDPGSREFALRTVDDGFGFKTKEGEYYYNIDGRYDYYNTFPKELRDSMHRLGRAYMQVHVQKFSNQ